MSGSELAKVGGLVAWQAHIGVYGSGVDPERARGHVFVVFGFGVHKKGERAGVAHQHALALAQERKGVGADAVPQAHGLHAGDHGSLKFFTGAGHLALGHDILEIRHGLSGYNNARHTAFQNSCGKAGLVQRSGLGQYAVALRQKVFYRYYLPAASQHHALSGQQPLQHGFFIGLGIELHHGRFFGGPHGAARKTGHLLHMLAGHNDAVHAGLKGQRYVAFVKGSAVEVNA